MIYALIGGNSIVFIVFFLRYASLPPQIPLFYTHATGEDQLGEWWMIFIIPLLMNIFVLLNGFIVKKFFDQNIFVEKLIKYLNVFLIIASVLIFTKIVFLIS